MKPCTKSKYRMAIFMESCTKGQTNTLENFKVIASGGQGQGLPGKEHEGTFWADVTSTISVEVVFYIYTVL